MLVTRLISLFNVHYSMDSLIPSWTSDVRSFLAPLHISKRHVFLWQLTIPEEEIGFYDFLQTDSHHSWRPQGTSLERDVYPASQFPASQLACFPTSLLPRLSTSLLTCFPTSPLPHFPASPLPCFPTFLFSSSLPPLFPASMLPQFPISLIFCFLASPLPYFPFPCFPFSLFPYFSTSLLPHLAAFLPPLLPTFPLTVLYITQNFIMARFPAFERNKVHQSLKIASISPKRLIYTLLGFSLSLCLIFSLVLSFVGCSDI